jgi:hypothetical protein
MANGSIRGIPNQTNFPLKSGKWNNDDVLIGKKITPEMITTNLIVDYDATNVSSYSGSGTIWTDIVTPSNNMTLYNGASFVSGTDSSINFDGVNDYASTGTTPTEFLGDPNLTICAFIKRTGTMSNNQGTWGIGGDVSAQGICSWLNNRSNEVAIDFWGMSTFSTGQTYPLNEWVFCTWQKTAGSFVRSNTSIWINSTKYTGTNLIVDRSETATVPAINNNGITLARISPSYSTPFPLRISRFFAYNRVLTDSEVLQNFNALRGKYGI